MAFFHFFDGGFAQIFSQIASITVEKLRNRTFISSRHVKRENTSLPIDVRRSKTSLLKLPIKSRRLRQTIKVNLYHMTKFSHYLPFSVHYFYKNISIFTSLLSIRIVLSCFYMPIFYIEKFST